MTRRRSKQKAKPGGKKTFTSVHSQPAVPSLYVIKSAKIGRWHFYHFIFFFLLLLLFMLLQRTTDVTLSLKQNYNNYWIFLILGFLWTKWVTALALRQYHFREEAAIKYWLLNIHRSLNSPRQRSIQAAKTWSAWYSFHSHSQ